MTSSDTIALSSLDTMEYDIGLRYDLAIAVWTTGDTSGTTVMMQSGFNRFSGPGWEQAAGLPFTKGAHNPHLLFPSGYSMVPILFDAEIEGQRDIFLLQEDYMDTTLVNISEDPTADDINAHGYMTPFIVKSSSSSIYTYFDALAMEKIRGTDSMLVFDKGYDVLDTIRTPGTNRNISIGSTLMGAAGNGASVYAVWESDRTGISHIYGRQRFIPWLAVEEPPPNAFVLHQNFPNPFNPSTTLRYDIPVAAHVRLAVYDILGREATELVSAFESAGSHAVVWDGSGFSSGVLAISSKQSLISNGGSWPSGGNCMPMKRRCCRKTAAGNRICGELTCIRHWTPNGWSSSIP
jgi:hypothetical protein